MQFHPLTPAGDTYEVKSRDGKRTYYLRVPSVADRARFRAELSVKAPEHPRDRMLDVLTAAVKVYLPDEDDADRRRFMEAIDAAKTSYADWIAALRSGSFDAMSMEDRKALFETAFVNSDAIVTAHKAVMAVADQDDAADEAVRYQEMTIDNAARPQLAAEHIARTFVMGWEGVSGTCERGRKGLVSESLQAIPIPDLFDIEAGLNLAMEPGSAEKNASAGSISTEESPTSSPSASNGRRKPRATQSSSTAQAH